MSVEMVDRIALFLIAHEWLIKIPFVLLPILIAVKIAKSRRKNCNWSRSEANSNIWLAVLLVLLSQLGLLVLFQRIPEPGSPASIASSLLLWYGVYLMARAVYRRLDLRTNGEAIAANDKGLVVATASEPKIEDEEIGQAGSKSEECVEAEAPPSLKPATGLKISRDGRIRRFVRWFRSSDGLIIVGVGLLVSGLMGFEPSSLWTVYNPMAPDLTPRYGFEAYESVAVTAVGAMMIAAGVLKRLRRGRDKLDDE